MTESETNIAEDYADIIRRAYHMYVDKYGGNIVHLFVYNREQDVDIEIYERSVGIYNKSLHNYIKCASCHELQSYLLELRLDYIPNPDRHYDNIELLIASEEPTCCQKMRYLLD